MKKISSKFKKNRAVMKVEFSAYNTFYIKIRLKMKRHTIKKGIQQRFLFLYFNNKYVVAIQPTALR